MSTASHPVCSAPEDRRPGARGGRRARLRRWLLVAAGTACVALGTVGVFLPVLPTTPFLLLAAACYLRSSARLHRWLFTNRLFGEYLRRYRAGEGLPLATKISTIALLWLSLGASSLAMPERLWWVRLLLLAVGVGVTLHLARIKTCRKESVPPAVPAPRDALNRPPAS